MTPEEQAKIRAEELAREQIRAEFRTKRTRKILLGCALALAGIIALPFVIIFGFAFLYGFLGLAQNENSATPQYVPPESIVGPITNGKASALSWKKVAAWKGDSTKNTESFHISSREWRIKWKAGGLFQIYVNDSGGNLVSVAVSTANAGADVSYVRTPPGSFNLQIICVGHPWEITVEQK